MKQKRPTVSIIMPVYNAGRFLAASIESILGQTLTDFEFLIIDDGSTDRSWSILKRFASKDKRIKLFRNTSNKGLVKSLNMLIPLAHGKFIARMDADDISLPSRLEKQVEYLSSNTTIVACGGQEYIMNEHGDVIADKFFPTDAKSCYNTLMNFMVIQPPLLMARGHIMRKLRYDNHIFKNDDISIHFKLLEHGDFGNVDSVIFKYRRVSNSLTHKNPKKVYFLALLVRLNAILRHKYRPHFVNIVLAVFETLLIALLPNAWILGLFEFMRFTKDSARRFITSDIFAPILRLANI